MKGANMADTSRPIYILGVSPSKFHRREAWQTPAQPVTGPAPTMEQWDTTPLHYTAAPTVPDGSDIETVFAYLRAIQNDYLTNRGYSVGYGFAITQAGDVIELRGYDIKNAANRGWNHRTGPILCLVDGADRASPEMVRAVNSVAGEHNRRTRRTLNLVGHRDIGATSCPGDGIYAQIRAGVFTPYDPPKPTEPTEPKAADMQFLRDHARIMDTRIAYGPFVPNVVHPCAAKGDLPELGKQIEDAEVVMVRVAAKGDGVGFLSLWADGGDSGNVAINYRPDEWETDLFPLPLDEGGSFMLRSTGSSATVTIDVVGAQFAEA